jgi:hypothetical protein
MSSNSRIAENHPTASENLLKSPSTLTDAGVMLPTLNYHKGGNVIPLPPTVQ